MAESNKEEISPRPLMRILGDFANSQILDAAIEYDFFTLVDKAARNALRKEHDSIKQAQIHV